jgi:hypothetical protein
MKSLDSPNNMNSGISRDDLNAQVFGQLEALERRYQASDNDLRNQNDILNKQLD